MNRSITLSRMENLTVKNYRQYNTFCISIEGNISLGRKNVGETLGPFAPSPSPSPSPTFPSSCLSSWVSGGLGLSVLSIGSSYASTHMCWGDCPIRGRRLSASTLAGWQGFFHSERKVLVVADPCSVPAQLSVKAGILTSNYLISSDIFLNEIWTQRRKWAVSYVGPKVPINILGSIWIT